MGEAKSPSRVKRVVGLLGRNPEILKTARNLLQSEFGPEEEVMAPIPFTWTRYYAREVGDSPWRTLVSYEDLMDRESLVEAKLLTNRLEQDLSVEGLRPVNLDPGYLTLGQFFLASTKDQRWRVYVRAGIYVEPTLYFQDGAFHPFPWTYRDYRSPEYLAWFASARSKLAFQRNHDGLPYRLRLSRSEAPPPPPEG